MNMLLDTRSIEEFNALFYDIRSWEHTSWCGIPIFKNPLDLHIIQEIIVETEPNIIIETGTYQGGSAHYYASILDMMQCNNTTLDRIYSYIFTIDIENMIHPHAAKHPRIFTLTKDSKLAIPSIKTWMNIVFPIKIDKTPKVMVILDSDHTYEHVKMELELYGALVTPGCYLIVEDTNTQGVAQALSEFLPYHPEFTADKKREKFLCTFNPGGFLKKE